MRRPPRSRGLTSLDRRGITLNDEENIRSGEVQGLVQHCAAINRMESCHRLLLPVKEKSRQVWRTKTFPLPSVLAAAKYGAPLCIRMVVSETTLHRIDGERHHLDAPNHRCGAVWCEVVRGGARWCCSLLRTYINGPWTWSRYSSRAMSLSTSAENLATLDPSKTDVEVITTIQATALVHRPLEFFAQLCHSRFNH